MNEYELAKVKFNNGYGALLCNECSIIIAEGFEHEDRVHLCPTCLLNKEREAVKIMIAILEDEKPEGDLNGN